jgi:hypothetical protein
MAQKDRADIQPVRSGTRCVGPVPDIDSQWDAPAPPAACHPHRRARGPASQAQPPTAAEGQQRRAGAGGHPARRAELRTGSDVLRLCETVRAHEMGGADAMREKAQEAYRGIVKSSNWPFGINKRVAAVRVRRSLRKVANSLELSARSAAAARKTWTDVVGSTQKLGKPSGFDPTR